ncbi:hypothetical protein [Zhongshania sp.]|uniref:TA system antitoxin ParD family protein n=1 Tax=Zhongshania sp. TaxID=1971902 RepID=UPI003569414D
MGIVKIGGELHEGIRKASSVMAHAINAQAEFWIKNKHARRGQFKHVIYPNYG